MNKTRGKIFLFTAFWLGLTLLVMWDLPGTPGANKGEYVLLEPIYGFEMLGSYLALLPACLILVISGMIIIKDPSRYKAGLKLLTACGVCASMFLLFRLLLNDIHGYGQVIAFLTLAGALLLTFIKISADGRSARSIFWFHFYMVVLAIANIYIQIFKLPESIFTSNVATWIFMPVVILGWLGLIFGVAIGYLFPCILLVALEEEKTPHGWMIFLFDVILTGSLYVPLLIGRW